MNCEVQRLKDNIRYRILIINGEQYILDMERSFWKIVFPFLFWVLPSTVFKVDDPAIVEQLKEPKREKTGSSVLISLAGIAYLIGILLAPLMEYFNISMTPVASTMLLVLLLILVAVLYLSISHKRKKELYDVVELETLQKDKLWIRPKSIKHIFKVLVVYIWFLGFVLLGSVAYLQTGNIMALIIGTGILFIVSLVSRITVEEGFTTIKFID
ncbi:DUF443 family protein [Virgibacillus sp. C22-A2]|uniref:DUF443 family protein n=1 Tax=Virgibacillus tibetensis TaxID=3042313 RepID=A0ABU6KJZ6_9BACI|nr:DUF443 family protein [Virgibacillus sp. C22-A2]